MTEKITQFLSPSDNHKRHSMGDLVDKALVNVHKHNAPPTRHSTCLNFRLDKGVRCDPCKRFYNKLMKDPTHTLARQVPKPDVSAHGTPSLRGTAFEANQSGTQMLGLQ